LPAAVHAFGEGVVVSDLRTMRHAIDESLAERRLALLLVGVFAAVTLVLTRSLGLWFTQARRGGAGPVRDAAAYELAVGDAEAGAAPLSP
jgi:hypothetical protein